MKEGNCSLHTATSQQPIQYDFFTLEGECHSYHTCQRSLRWLLHRDPPPFHCGSDVAPQRGGLTSSLLASHHLTCCMQTLSFVSATCLSRGSLHDADILAVSSLVRFLPAAVVCWGIGVGHHLVHGCEVHALLACARCC
jgi:hypothetical protein